MPSIIIILPWYVATSSVRLYYLKVEISIQSLVNFICSNSVFLQQQLYSNGAQWFKIHWLLNTFFTVCDVWPTLTNIDSTSCVCWDVSWDTSENCRTCNHHLSVQWAKSIYRIMVIILKYSQINMKRHAILTLAPIIYSDTLSNKAGTLVRPYRPIMYININ